MKDPLVIGQYGASFRSSIVETRIFKMNRVEDVQQLIEQYPRQNIQEISQVMNTEYFNSYGSSQGNWQGE